MGIRKKSHMPRSRTLGKVDGLSRDVKPCGRNRKGSMLGALGIRLRGVSQCENMYRRARGNAAQGEKQVGGVNGQRARSRTQGMGSHGSGTAGQKAAPEKAKEEPQQSIASSNLRRTLQRKTNKSPKPAPDQTHAEPATFDLKRTPETPVRSAARERMSWPRSRWPLGLLVTVPQHFPGGSEGGSRHQVRPLRARLWNLVFIPGGRGDHICNLAKGGGGWDPLQTTNGSSQL